MSSDVLINASASTHLLFLVGECLRNPIKTSRFGQSHHLKCKNNCHRTTVRFQLFLHFRSDLDSNLEVLIYLVKRYNKPMEKNLLLKESILLLLVIGVLDLIAGIFYLHWTVWWYDVILHFIGGAWAAMAVILFWHSIISSLKNNQLKLVIVGIIGAFIIGLLWEVYELIIDATSISYGLFYWTDTTSDILLDICGGFFAALHSFKIIRSHSSQ